MRVIHPLVSGGDETEGKKAGLLCSRQLGHWEPLQQLTTGKGVRLEDASASGCQAPTCRAGDPGRVCACLESFPMPEGYDYQIKKPPEAVE